MSAENKKQAAEQWARRQEKLASDSGMAIAIVEADGLDSISLSNNNSVCSVLSRSKEFEPACRKYCGSVYSQSLKTKKPFKYQCHAGLECVAIPVSIKGRKPVAAIVGRAFTKAEDYRLATNKAVSGEWSGFAPSAVFENILLTGSQNVEILAKKFASLDGNDKALLGAVAGPLADAAEERKPPKSDAAAKIAPGSDAKKAPVVEPSRPGLRIPKINEVTRKKSADVVSKERVPSVNAASPIGSAEELAEQAGWRSLFGDMLDGSYADACKLILEFLQSQYGISSLAWLENYGSRLTTTHAVGSLRTQKIQISVGTDDPRLKKLLTRKVSIELRSRAKTGSGSSDSTVRLFPIIVGKEIRSALVLGEGTEDARRIESIGRFCKSVTSELEILRLREELSRRSWRDIALQKFNDSLKKIDTEDFWMRLMQTTAELLQAERGSLLLHDEKTGELVVKAAIGRKADLLKTDLPDLGVRVAKDVWKTGEALVVRDITKSGIEPAPEDWKYKTGSFISYPLVIAERRIGVLNIADKVDGNSYSEIDISLLGAVVPQIAVAADRANLKNQAGEFKQLSLTDPLTGLLNRRYLEERLAEEIKRSNRHGFPMSFMMIDVDDFKSYNDQFLHPEGDKALKIVGHCLRDTLRGADVAARYGGEEFSILLPQTTLGETKTIAERIRSTIESADFPHRQVTVSIGIATLTTRISSVEKLIECADKALFKAKREGKNTVHVFQEAGSGSQAAIR